MIRSFSKLLNSLDAQNAFLRHWNRTIALLRIHGTTRRQVWTHFFEVEQYALQPLARPREEEAEEEEEPARDDEDVERVGD